MLNLVLTFSILLSFRQQLRWLRSNSGQILRKSEDLVLISGVILVTLVHIVIVWLRWLIIAVRKLNRPSIYEVNSFL